jgi:hypothetical protein
MDIVKLPAVAAALIPELPAGLAADLEDCIARVEAAALNKSFASPDGWCFLTNDTNDYLRWQFGLRRWTPEQLQKAARNLIASGEALAAVGAKFAAFIMPEKSAVYARYMPGLLATAQMYEARPARLLGNASDCPATYLFDSLADMDKLGLTYFRGDSHPNWFGSYVAYATIHAELSALLPLTPPLALQELLAVAATHGGDLFDQLPPGTAEAMPWMVSLMQSPSRAESLIKYTIDPAKRRAKPAEVPEDYVKWFTSRETLVWEHEDRALPRCVIFRDSTASRFLDYLAEHFSRTVAVWWHGVVVEDVIEREKPDIVIKVQAERFLHLAPTVRPMVKVAEVLAAVAYKEKLRQAAARQDAAGNIK